jgi:hypothetical protein
VKLAKCGQRVIGQPVLELIERLLPGKHLHPGDPPLAAIGLFHHGIEHPLRRPPDVRTGAVALDEGDDGLIRHLQPGIGHANRLAVSRYGHVRKTGGHAWILIVRFNGMESGIRLAFQRGGDDRDPMKRCQRG